MRLALLCFTSRLALLAMSASAVACSNGAAIGSGGGDVSGGAGGAPATGGHHQGGGGSTAGLHLVLPAFVDLPYVVAGAGGSSLDVTVTNDGDEDAPAVGQSKLVWSLDGDASLTMSNAPDALPAHGSAKIHFSFTGAASESIAAATLSVATGLGSVKAKVFGVAGDASLGAASWEALAGPGGVRMGEGATVAMPTAPYPDGSGPYDDPSVHVFLPDGYRERGAQDLVVHFHGFDATLAETLPAHLYREQVYASGSNAVLVVPQGPVNAASGDFGKLMNPMGLANLTREVLVVLYRDGKIEAPVPGELRLTSHSGGYDAVATNLMPAAMAPPIVEVGLFDSMYGFVSTFESFVTSGGKLRTSYTCCGGTESDNQTCQGDLTADGVSVVTTQTQSGLRDADAVDFFADSSHDGSTRVDGDYGEELRWNMTHSRRGPRLELREVTAKAGTAHVTWLSPRDADLLGFEVEASPDGASWSTVAKTGATASSASFPLSGGARVRVVPRVAGVKTPLPSDTYRVDEGAKILVVDGFDRVVDGAFGGLSHDFAALVGEAAGPVATVAHRALTEDVFDLGVYDTVIWSLGDESTADHALSDAEQALITTYLDGGGHLVAAGSELGYTLDQSSAGQTFLADVFGAAFAADASGSYTAVGDGALAGVASFSYSSAGGPYVVAFPDAFTTAGSGELVLAYGNGMGAAVGVAGKAVIVGFPLELVDAAPKRKAVVEALVHFVGG